jgi:hypothetical protein
MKTVGFGKREGFAHEAGQPLAQGIEPALDMVGFAAVFANRLMAVSGENAPISLPEIAERRAACVGAWDAPPEVQATGFTAVANEVGDNLPCTATHGHPHPPLVSFLEHKRPHFIQLQHIIQLSGGQRRFQRRQVLGPVLNPVGDRASRETKQALDAPQTDPFQHRAFHLRPRALIVSLLRVQRAIARAGFAVVFLVTFVIMTVSHQVFTAALRTRMRYNRLYHEKVLQMDLVVYPGLPFHALSVKTSPLPLSATCLAMKISGCIHAVERARSTPLSIFNIHLFNLGPMQRAFSDPMKYTPSECESSGRRIPPIIRPADPSR